jgi:phage-related baseplate assembly protein
VTTLIDLSRLPAPLVIEALDYEAILAAMKADLAARAPELAAVLALESEPAVKVLEACAYRELLLRARINDAARALLVAHATGADLDHLAANVGTARAVGEPDSRLRTRVQAAFWAPAAAGPGGTYRWHAMAAHADVIDVGVHSPRPGDVQVTVLAAEAVDPADATDAEIAAGQALFPDRAPPSGQVWRVGRLDAAPLADVRRALDADAVVPLTDRVQVVPPELAVYTLAAELTLYPGPDADVVRAEAEAAVAAELLALRRIGHDHARARLIAALARPGVQNVELASPPADVVIPPTGIAACTAVAITVAEARDA